jgi:two-component system invasion response regulator UvrY
MDSCSIYLLDDHPIVRAGMRLLVQSWGYQVVGESSEPTEALADVRRLSPQAVLLGLNLGRCSGLDLLAGIQGHDLPIPCVVLTGSNRPEHLSQALRLGARAYVLKSSDPSELQAALAAAMQGKHYLCNGADELAARALGQASTSAPDQTLSRREQHIARLVVQGYSSRAIGSLLHLSPKTVATYRSRTMRKLGVRNACDMVRLAVEEGWIESSPTS